MAKIEDLTELLVSELSVFEKGIAKLEVLEKRINNTKIEVDLKELKPIIAAHESAMSSSKQHQEHYLKRLETLLKNAKVYPKWAVITFMVMVLLTCSVLFYTYTIKANAINAKEEAYQEGLNTYGNYIIQFLNEHPRAEKEFEIWKKSK